MDERKRQSRASWQGSGIGWTMVADILTGTLLWGGLGYLADRWLGTAPILMIVGFVLGHATGIYAATLHTRRMREKAAEEEGRL